uniref:Uncharacterized protein n=1 Tax=Fagus sylvatica TaxID=28930 RepID=A0A2N9FBL1_FAGSY
MAPGSRGAGAVFVCFSGEDSDQTGDATGEPRVARRNRSRHLSNAPRLRVNLQRVGKTLRAKAALPTSDFGVLGTVGKFAACPLFQVPRLTEKPSLGSRDTVPRTGAAGVFLVRWRTFFRSGFRLDLGKSWRSESSTLCMNVSSFQRAWACGSTCSPDIGFRRSWYRRKACATYFLKVQALRRGELGFARCDLANRGCWGVPYAKGHFLIEIPA